MMGRSSRQEVLLKVELASCTATVVSVTSPMVPEVRSHDTNKSCPAVSALAMGRKVSTAQAPNGIALVGVAKRSRVNCGLYSDDIVRVLPVEMFKAVK